MPDAITNRPLFADTLCQLMDSAGVSGSELARRLGSNKTSVSRWRTGEDLPRPQFVAEIADTLGVDRTMLLQAAGYLKPDEGSEPDLQTSIFPADQAETEWLELYRQLATEHRPTITEIIRRLAVQPTRQPPKRRTQERHMERQPQRAHLDEGRLNGTLHNDEDASGSDNGRLPFLGTLVDMLLTRRTAPSSA